MSDEKINITETLVRHLIIQQFPQWSNLPIQPLQNSGWDNRTFHLGTDMLVRLPSATEYAGQAEKEQAWLPILAPKLPLPIPSPIAMGKPDESYPWKWSINRWLPGDSALVSPIDDMCHFAKHLALFLKALQNIDASHGPIAGPHSFYRGGNLEIYDKETREAIEILKDKIDYASAIDVWETALSTSWQKTPVWVHGDVSSGNLLVHQGVLSAVIDFGQLAVGDPACDLVIAWTLFEGKNRDTFYKTIDLDPATWSRGRAWALWKALILAAGIADSNNVEIKKCLHITKEVIAEHKRILK